MQRWSVFLIQVLLTDTDVVDIELYVEVNRAKKGDIREPEKLSLQVG